MNDNVPLIDSNILVYAYDVSEKEKHPLAKKLLRQCWSGEKIYAVSLQNLSEFFVNVTKKVERPISKDKAAHIIKNIFDFAGFIKLEPKEKTIKQAIHLCCKENINYWDALLVAIMQENTISDIYTENVKDFKITGITAINPFVKV